MRSEKRLLSDLGLRTLLPHWLPSPTPKIVFDPVLQGGTSKERAGLDTSKLLKER